MSDLTRLSRLVADCAAGTGTLDEAETVAREFAVQGAILVEGAPLRGAVHPEMGHLRTPRHPADRDFPGVCPFHSDCVEGLASGSAVRARWGAPLEELPAGHPARGILPFYLAHLCAGLTYLLSPHRILLGGGVMTDGGLLPEVRRVTGELLAGYPGGPHLEDGLEGYLQAPAFGGRAGGLGALALAERAWEAAGGTFSVAGH
jgi:fructokinase